MPAGGVSVWLAALVGALSAGLGRIVAFLPALLGAIVILLIGWGISKLIQAAVTRGLEALHFNKLMDREGVNQSLQRAGVKRNSAQILGIIAYWFVFLLAIQAAISVLGIESLTTLMGAVILYLPRIFAAIVVIIAGAWAASFLARVTSASATTAGISYAGMLGSVVQGAVLFFTFAIALDVLGLSFPFLTTAFAIILGAFALAGAIAYGLGGREYATDTLAGRELRSVFQKGDRLVSTEIDGTVENIGPTMTTIRTEAGVVALQNSELMHQHVMHPERHKGEGGGSTRHRAA
ncbi:MAG: mechanosensitive ion channel family protein [Armatimonadota bacterium]